MLSTLATVERGDAVTIVAESSLPPARDVHYVKKALNPKVKRHVGLAVLDERQSSPATKAFIALATKKFRMVSSAVSLASRELVSE